MLAAMPAFAPLIGDRPKVLILGSMPSQQSLSVQQYYAHPRNAFWWIMQRLCGAPCSASLSYQQRCQLLTDNGVAVWDVLADCQRPGSLDANIVRESEQPNDFELFFAAHPTIQVIAFNGAAANKIFSRHCKSCLATRPELQLFQLPSTSPAHAALSKQQKLVKWQSVLSAYL